MLFRSKDGVELEKRSNKYKGHIFYCEKGIGFKCLGFNPKLDECTYKNMETGVEVSGCVSGFYFSNPLKKSLGGATNAELTKYDQWLKGLSKDTILGICGYDSLKELNEDTGETHTMKDVIESFDDVLRDEYEEQTK